MLFKIFLKTKIVLFSKHSLVGASSLKVWRAEVLKISEAAAVWKSCDFYNDEVTAGAAAMAVCHLS